MRFFREDAASQREAEAEPFWKRVFTVSASASMVTLLTTFCLHFFPSISVPYYGEKGRY